MEKLKILIAEDEETTRKLFAIAFRDESFDTRLVTNGEDALAAYKEWQPDIVILDIMMPHMNGYKTLSTIRQTLNDSATTVVIASALSDKKEILACAMLGIQGYIVKPFRTQELARTVLGYHNGRRQ